MIRSKSVSFLFENNGAFIKNQFVLPNLPEPLAKKKKSVDVKALPQSSFSQIIVSLQEKSGN